MTIAVKRALSLLDLFSESTPEIGLSDAARRSGHDKATVHRLLNTLRDAELIEQDAGSRLYRLGPAVLRLARVREAASPVISVALPLLDRLASVTGETSHCSLYTGNALVVIAACESRKPNHVSMRRSETLPLHATASGLAFLAFARSDIVDRALLVPRQAFTRWTPVEAGAIDALLQQTRQTGYAAVDRAYDEDVYGIAAPVFGPDQSAIGAMAVAVPLHRITAEFCQLIIAEVKAAARDLTHQLGNLPPNGFDPA